MSATGWKRWCITDTLTHTRALTHLLFQSIWMCWPVPGSTNIVSSFFFIPSQGGSEVITSIVTFYQSTRSEFLNLASSLELIRAGVEIQINNTQWMDSLKKKPFRESVADPAVETLSVSSFLLFLVSALKCLRQTKRTLCAEGST